MDYLLLLDAAIFRFINGWPHLFLTDHLAIFLSGIGSYAIIWILLGFWLLYKEEAKDHLFIGRVALASVFSFCLTEWFLKPFFNRTRPQFLDGTILVTGDLLATRSFPSGHATIAFALAYVLARKEPRWRGAFYLLAFLISLSRIYLGYHYPLDVLAGATLGTAIGFLVSYLKKPGQNRKKRKN